MRMRRPRRQVPPSLLIRPLSPQPTTHSPRPRPRRSRATTRPPPRWRWRDSSCPAPRARLPRCGRAPPRRRFRWTKHQLNGATIKSPIAGVVSQGNVSAGQAVSGGGSGTGTSSSYAIVVYSPGSYEVTGTVSDAQVNLVAVGQTVQVTPAGSTQALQGKVTAISPAATITSGVATFGVTAELTDTSKSIKPGISATAT